MATLLSIESQIPSCLSLIPISLAKMTIPVATEVRESAVISASVDDLWNLIQLSNVASFWTNLKEVQSSANVTKWTFHDGTVLDVKQEEHSVWNHLRPGSETE